MKQSLEMRLGQRLTMTPQLQQAIRLLQLSAMDLQTEIQQALEQNPLLEEKDDSSEVADAGSNGSDDVRADSESELDLDSGLDAAHDQADFSFESTGDWDESFETHVASNVRDGGEDFGYHELDSRSSAPFSLREHLHWQMCMTPLSDTDRKIADALIDSINEDGYLTCSLTEIQQALRDEADVEIADIEVVLRMIQSFDPIGVGARDLKECLLIQLRHFHEDTPELEHARHLVENHLELLGNRDFTHLQRVLKVDPDGLRDAVQLIRSLHPRPGSAITPANPSYIVPDIVVRKVRGVWRAELNPEIFPRIQINRTYQSMLRRGQDTPEKRYIQGQLQEARWFIKSLRNRNETLLRVATAIIERQEEFLEHGEKSMRPMVLSDIAQALNMHESTISRATTQKYMLTPRGIFELKYFFSSSVSTIDGGSCSSTVIRSWIRKYIDDEPPARPISDSQIAKRLAQQGISVARRTVAKYRENMKIPPSNQRKAL